VSDGGPGRTVRRLFVGDDGLVRPLWRIVTFVVWFSAALVLLQFAAWRLAPEIGPEALGVQGVLALAVALAVGWACLRLLEDRPPSALGFAWTRRTPRELWLGFLIGGASLALAIALLVLLGWIRYAPAPGSALEYVSALGWYLVLLAGPAAAEEAVFRGYPFQVLVAWIGPVLATALASGLFAAAHLGNPEIDAGGLLNIFLAGVLLSVAYLRTRSLWFATAVHLGWNWTMAGPLDMPVSGLDWFPTPLYTPVPHGPAWVTGGAFGPEGGLVATLAFLLALGAVIRFTGHRTPGGVQS
jgi:uncharacterized protein